MSSSSLFSLSLLILLFQLNLTKASGENVELVFEEGYSVSTVLDGDKCKVKINPQSVIPHYQPSDQFVLLDSAASTFYTLSFPTSSNESVIERLAGNGNRGYKDGNLDTAMFNRPRSFAVDYKGNVYVADKVNHAIRKITKSGVTTIAGGHLSGRTDGLASNASFSDDFELTFVPGRCALLISDHGNRLIRQINLKSEDCTRKSESVLGATSFWLLGVGLSCFVGLVIGFVIRPYVVPYEDYKHLRSNVTWRHCLTSLERRATMLFSEIKNATVNSKSYSFFARLFILSFSYLSLVFRFKILESRVTCQKSIPLIDLDEIGSSSCSTSNNGKLCQKTIPLMDLDEIGRSSCSSSSNNGKVDESSMVNDQLKGLFDFDGGVILTERGNELVGQEVEKKRTDGSIDSMIIANLLDFEEQTPLGLVKRR